jgi:hypothetical protein
VIHDNNYYIVKTFEDLVMSTYLFITDIAPIREDISAWDSIGATIDMGPYPTPFK